MKCKISLVKAVNYISMHVVSIVKLMKRLHVGLKLIVQHLNRMILSSWYLKAYCLR